MAGKKTSPKKTKRGKTAKKKTAGKKQKRSLFMRLTKWILVLGLWGVIGVGLILGWYARELPSITANADFERQNAITILAADGSVLTRYGEMRGNTIDFDELPSHLIYAVLAIEDRRFYSHFGVDPLGILRAMIVNIKAGGVVQGGSTITQQLAKNLFLTHERTLKRKIQEAMLAIWLERQLSKDEILSAYLNRVYLGSGTYGVDAASRLYFEKPVSEINLREAATMAGLFKAPSRFSPLRNPGLSQERADTVLRAMADAGYISEERAQGLAELPPRPFAKPSEARSERYFTDWVVDGLDDLIGTPGEDLIVETTLDPTLQQRAEEILLAYLKDNGAEKKISQGALLFTRKDGAVLAMIGGRNFSESQFNRAVQAKRQPGSAFKPFVYLTALEMGWDPRDELEDAPITEGRYRPENHGKKYYGEVNLEEALALSLNTVSVKLMKETGVRPVMETARRLGIISPLEPDLSLALGTSGVSMLEMVAAYGAIGNGGLSVFPFAITRIRDKNGKVYYQRPRETITRRVVEERAVKQLQAMMTTTVELGTARGANPGFPVGGKTGTSQESRDAWFVGFSDDVVGAVWLGNDDNTPMDKVTGGSIPSLIWRDVIRVAQSRHDDSDTFMGLQSSDGFGGLMTRLLSGEPVLREEPTRRRAEEDANAHRSNARYNN